MGGRKVSASGAPLQLTMMLRSEKWRIQRMERRDKENVAYHTIKYYSALQKEILPLVTPWTSLEDIIEVK